MNEQKQERCCIGDREELFLRNRAKATGPLNVYDRQLMLDAAHVICELQDLVSRAPLPDNKALTCTACEARAAHEGGAPNCSVCRPPEKGE